MKIKYLEVIQCDERLEKRIKELVMERDITFAEAEAIVMTEENDLN